MVLLLPHIYKDDSLGVAIISWQKLRALERLEAKAKTHLGHTIETHDVSGVLIGARIDRDKATVLLQIQGETFPTIYIDSVKRCSCENSL